MSRQEHLPLAPRDLVILAVLAEGPRHGYGLIKAVESRSESGVLLDPANLYRVLRRMKGQGWIREASAAKGPSASAGETGTGSGEPAAGTDSRRRTYEITPVGRSLLSAELHRLERLLRQVRPAMADGERG